MEQKRFQIHPQLDPIVSGYLDLLKNRLGTLHCTPTQIDLVIEDIRNRFTLLNRWNDADFVRPLLFGPAVEEASFYEPFGHGLVPCVINLCVRNSLLEEIHTDYPSDPIFEKKVKDEDIPGLTSEAIRYFSSKGIPNISGFAPSAFDDLPANFPKTWEAFSILHKMEGTKKEFRPTKAHKEIEIPPRPTSLVDMESRSVGESGVSLKYGNRLLESLYQIVNQEIEILFVPSLKWVTRNTSKLFSVIEILLNHQAALITQNFLIAPGVVCKRRGALKPLHNVSGIEAQFEAKDGLCMLHRKMLDQLRRQLYPQSKT